MSRKRCFYFAYGSNLHPLRLQERVPSARLLGKALLKGHDVLFGKRGMDGSGKCSVAPVVGVERVVHGAIYEMSRSEREALDAAEGPDYERKSEAFLAAGSTVDAFYYEARELHPRDFLRPFDWYRDLVLVGARFHALPDAYIRRLATAECTPDPDENRARRMTRLLARISSV